MKISDYAPRSGALDAHLSGVGLTGIEVGCDVGAHAEALLTYCSVKRLVVVDLWENPFCEGYCMGRLQSKGFKNFVEFVKADSHEASKRYRAEEFDFVYIDIMHDSETVSQSLEDWWPKVNPGGMLAYRNYTMGTIRPVIDAFAERHHLRTKVESYHNEMILYKDAPQ
jgi:predicted O-methyltransferase YrrM